MSDITDWPAELDAVIATPKYHHVLLENNKVRVLESRIEPGEVVPLHTHRWSGVYHILSWSDFLRRDAKGKVVVDTRGSDEPPAALWADPIPPHTLENVGTKTLHVVNIELKHSLPS